MPVSVCRVMPLQIVHGLQTDEPLVVLPELVYASLWSKGTLAELT